MAWQDRLQSLENATFKGVPFKYENVTSTVGRRTQVTDLPGRDTPHTEDLGRRSRRFRITAYVLGTDYDIDRDRLIRAIEGGRPGLLVHPYWGNRTVRVEGDVPVTESPGEGGMARFEITFVDVEGEEQPLRRRDAQGEVVSRADDVLTAVREAFAEAFSVVDAVGDIRDEAVEVVEGIAEVAQEVKSQIDQAVGIVDTVHQVVSVLADTAESLISLPNELASAVTSAVSGVLESVASVGAAAERLARFPDTLTAPFRSGSVSDRHRAVVLMRAWRGLHAFGDTLPLVAETSGQQALRAANQAALVRLLRVTAITETCRTAGQIAFDSFDQAQAVLDEISEAVDEIVHDVDDATYGALQDLRAALHRRIADAAETLPRIVELTLEHPTPALVVAHRLYGDATRDAEILDRNPHVRNPALISAGTVLKVLSV